MTGLTLLFVLVVIVLLILLLSIAARINRQQELLEKLDRKIEKLIIQSKENAPTPFTANISQQMPVTAPAPVEVKEIVESPTPEKPFEEKPIVPPIAALYPEEEEYVASPKVISEPLRP
ncbi:MAG: hypothetical protein JNL59_04595, partial [Chitinophagaceae bacterium]|nr:hypothetical protein [Chitinophagaceae bacterium]